MPDQPMQPVVVDSADVHRFQCNTVVLHLLNCGGIDMNTLARLKFPDVDRAQFAQLIGYSVSGYGELSYTELDAAYEAAQPGNSDGECIAKALFIVREAERQRMIAVLVEVDGDERHEAERRVDAALMRRSK